jgi:hypothetical protein
VNDRRSFEQSVALAVVNTLLRFSSQSPSIV